MEMKDFEATLARLEQIVSELEKGDQSLEASLKLFEEGMKTAEFCSGKAGRSRPQGSGAGQGSGQIEGD